MSDRQSASSWIEYGGLFLLVFSLSLLAWNGLFHTSDGIAMYAVSDSLARYGTWDIEQIRWIGLQQGTYGPDGLLYSRKGIATSLLALPLVWLGLALPGIGPIHAATLLTPLVHAATALYLYGSVRIVLPERRGVALGIALLWAFASMALPYVKTFFSEPTVALTMMAALWHLLRFRLRARLLDALALGGWLALSLNTRAANAVVFPLFALALWHYARQSGGGALISTATLKRLVAFGLPLLLGGLGYLAYNAYRFGNPLDSGYIESETFSAIWWQGIVGQTVSPGRGLLWYTPWLPLALWGGWRLWQRDRLLATVVGGSVVAYILLYGKWYLWSGGFAWGPRFLLPILPFVAFLLAFLWSDERAPRPWTVRLLALTGALAFLINLIGVLWDPDLHQRVLVETGLPLFALETFFDPRYAQIPGLLAAGLARPDSWDLAWTPGGQPVPYLLAIALLTALGGALAGWRSWRQRRGAPLLLAGSAVLLVGGYLLLRGMHREQAPTLQAALAQLPPVLTGGAQLWYDAPGSSEALLNQVGEPARITGFFVEGAEVPPEDAARAESLASNARAPIWLISDGPDPLGNGLDRTLLDHLFRVGEQQAGGYRVAEYWQGPLSEPIPYDLRFAQPDGATLTLLDARVTPEVHRGNVLALLLRWQVETLLPEGLQLFVHLYDSSGQVVQQADGPLVQGLRPPSALLPGEILLDHHAFRVSPELPSGSYSLHVGLYRIDTLERAVTPDGQSEIILPIAIR